MQTEDRLLSALPLCCNDLKTAEWWFPHAVEIWRQESVRKHKFGWAIEKGKFCLLFGAKHQEKSYPDEEAIPFMTSSKPRGLEIVTKLKLIFQRFMIYHHLFPCAPVPNLCLCLCKVDCYLAQCYVLKIYSSVYQSIF